MSEQPIIPPEWTWVYVLVVGQQWPQADEDALRRAADAWGAAHTALVPLADDATIAANRVGAAAQGTSGQVFAENTSGYINTGYLSDVCRTAADCERNLRQYADQVEFTKLAINIQIAVLILQLLWDAVLAPLTLGASAGAGMLAVAAGRATVREFLLMLLRSVLTMAAPDFIAQSVMIFGRHERGGYNWAEVLRAGETGAVAGLVGGALGKATAASGLTQALESRFGMVGGGLANAALHGAATNGMTVVAMDSLTGQFHGIGLAGEHTTPDYVDDQPGQNILDAMLNGAFIGGAFHTANLRFTTFHFANGTQVHGFRIQGELYGLVRPDGTRAGMAGFDGRNLVGRLPDGTDINLQPTRVTDTRSGFTFDRPLDQVGVVRSDRVIVDGTVSYPADGPPPPSRSDVGDAADSRPGANPVIPTTGSSERAAEPTPTPLDGTVVDAARPVSFAAEDPHAGTDPRTSVGLGDQTGLRPIDVPPPTEDPGPTNLLRVEPHAADQSADSPPLTSIGRMAPVGRSSPASMLLMPPIPLAPQHAAGTPETGPADRPGAELTGRSLSPAAPTHGPGSSGPDGMTTQRQEHVFTTMAKAVNLALEMEHHARDLVAQELHWLGVAEQARSDGRRDVAIDAIRHADELRDRRLAQLAAIEDAAIIQHAASDHIESAEAEAVRRYFSPKLARPPGDLTRREQGDQRKGLANVVNAWAKLRVDIDRSAKGRAQAQVAEAAQSLEQALRARSVVSARNGNPPPTGLLANLVLDLFGLFKQSDTTEIAILRERLAAAEHTLQQVQQATLAKATEEYGASEKSRHARVTELRDHPRVAPHWRQDGAAVPIRVLVQELKFLAQDVGLWDKVRGELETPTPAPADPVRRFADELIGRGYVVDVRTEPTLVLRIPALQAVVDDPLSFFTGGASRATSQQTSYIDVRHPQLGHFVLKATTSSVAQESSLGLFQDALDAATGAQEQTYTVPVGSSTTTVSVKVKATAEHVEAPSASATKEVNLRVELVQVPDGLGEVMPARTETLVLPGSATMEYFNASAGPSTELTVTLATKVGDLTIEVALSLTAAATAGVDLGRDLAQQVGSVKQLLQFLAANEAGFSTAMKASASVKLDGTPFHQDVSFTLHGSADGIHGRAQDLLARLKRLVAPVLPGGRNWIPPTDFVEAAQQEMALDLRSADVGEDQPAGPPHFAARPGSVGDQDGSLLRYQAEQRAELARRQDAEVATGSGADLGRYEAHAAQWLELEREQIRARLAVPIPTASPEQLRRYLQGMQDGPPPLNAYQAALWEPVVDPTGPLDRIVTQVRFDVVRRGSGYLPDASGELPPDALPDRTQIIVRLRLDGTHGDATAEQIAVIEQDTRLGVEYFINRPGYLLPDHTLLEVTVEFEHGPSAAEPDVTVVSGRAVAADLSPARSSQIRWVVSAFPEDLAHEVLHWLGVPEAYVEAGRTAVGVIPRSGTIMSPFPDRAGVLDDRPVLDAAQLAAIMRFVDRAEEVDERLLSPYGVVRLRAADAPRSTPGDILGGLAPHAPPRETDPAVRRWQVETETAPAEHLAAVTAALSEAVRLLVVDGRHVGLGSDPLAVHLHPRLGNPIDLDVSVSANPHARTRLEMPAAAVHQPDRFRLVLAQDVATGGELATELSSLLAGALQQAQAARVGRIARLVTGTVAGDYLDPDRPAPGRRPVSAAERGQHAALALAVRHTADGQYLDVLRRALVRAGAFADQDRARRRIALRGILSTRPEHAALAALLFRDRSRADERAATAALDLAARSLVGVLPGLRGARVDASGQQPILRVLIAPDERAPQGVLRIPITFAATDHRAAIELSRSHDPSNHRLTVRADSSNQAIMVDTAQLLSEIMTGGADRASAAEVRWVVLRDLYHLGDALDRTIIQHEVRALYGPAPDVEQQARISEHLQELRRYHLPARLLPWNSPSPRLPVATSPGWPHFTRRLSGAIGTAGYSLAAGRAVGRELFLQMNSAATTFAGNIAQARADQTLAKPPEAHDLYEAGSWPLPPATREDPPHRPISDNVRKRSLNATASAAVSGAVLFFFTRRIVESVAGLALNLGSSLLQAFADYLADYPEQLITARRRFEESREPDSTRNHAVRSTLYRLESLRERLRDRGTLPDGEWQAVIADLKTTADHLDAMLPGLRREVADKITDMQDRRHLARRWHSAWDEFSGRLGHRNGNQPAPAQESYLLTARGVDPGAPSVWHNAARVGSQGASGSITSLVLGVMSHSKSIGLNIANLFAGVMHGVSYGTGWSLLAADQVADRTAVQAWDARHETGQSLQIIQELLDQLLHSDALTLSQPVRREQPFALLRWMGHTMSQRRLDLAAGRPNPEAWHLQVAVKHLPGLAGRALGLTVSAVILFPLAPQVFVILVPGAVAVQLLLAGGETFARTLPGYAERALQIDQLRAKAAALPFDIGELAGQITAVAADARAANDQIRPVIPQPTPPDRTGSHGGARLSAAVDNRLHLAAPPALRPGPNAPHDARLRLQLTAVDRAALDRLARGVRELQYALSGRPHPVALDPAVLRADLAVRLQQLGLRWSQPGARQRWDTAVADVQQRHGLDLNSTGDLSWLRADPHDPAGGWPADADGQLIDAWLASAERTDPLRTPLTNALNALSADGRIATRDTPMISLDGPGLLRVVRPGTAWHLRIHVDELPADTHAVLRFAPDGLLPALLGVHSAPDELIVSPETVGQPAALADLLASVLAKVQAEEGTRLLRLGKLWRARPTHYSAGP